VRDRRVGILRSKAGGAGVLPQPVRTRGQRRCADTADGGDIPNARREPGRTVRRAGRRRVRGRFRRARADPADVAAEAWTMRIAILCYASVGGSGVVATELAHALARRGHDVHVLSRERPFRWRSDIAGVSFVRVEMPSHPLFREPQYLLAMANSIVRLSRERRFDIVHAHYAVPHATAAYLAHRILACGPDSAPPPTVTTLHGTDIRLVGSDPAYEE